ncbi:MAG: aspartate kinase [Chitinophagaceae bacterium]|nr:aspartate kinase [Chitinophagaceae bacterium]
MKVFKFGGASVNSIDRVKNLASIVDENSDSNLVIIISAMGKTTNALEKVAEAFYAGKKEEALQLFHAIKQQHLNNCKYLLVTKFNACVAQMADFFTEVEWLLHDKPVRDFDYYYDQIVCLGELLSTCIISHYLNESGISNVWLDVRDSIRTDNNFRDATVDWTSTSEKITRQVSDIFSANFKIIITQGYIGATEDNESTTLGREGSDYSAAIFANILNAESLTIWKDVEGVMNADPKSYPNAVLIDELNYTEVIEMAYYGAQVIHPKTIKPLQNKSIPLFVKCFLNSSLPGTIIHEKKTKGLPPIIVMKSDQVLIELKTQDFSFIGDEPIIKLYSLFKHLHIKPNLIQTAAISVFVCLDNRPDKIEQLALTAGELFDVQVEKGLSLLTIRHYNDTILNELSEGKSKVLKQQSEETVQVLFK